MCSRMICPRFLTSGGGTISWTPGPSDLWNFLNPQKSGQRRILSCPKGLAPVWDPGPMLTAIQTWDHNLRWSRHGGDGFRDRNQGGKFFGDYFSKKFQFYQNLNLNISIQYLSYITYHISSNCNSKMSGRFNDKVIMSPLPFVNQECNLDASMTISWIHGFYWIDFLDIKIPCISVSESFVEPLKQITRMNRTGLSAFEVTPKINFNHVTDFPPILAGENYILTKNQTVETVENTWKHAFWSWAISDNKNQNE